MGYFKRTTQVPNELIDHLMKTLSSSELRVLLFIIRRTYGMVDPNNKQRRVQRAWISQKLFSVCCNLSGRSVSSATDGLVKKKLIEVTDAMGNTLQTKEKRRGKTRLYYASRLRLETSKKKASELACNKPVKKVHKIKPTEIKSSCGIISQGVKRLSDIERYHQIQQSLTTNTRSNTD